MIGLSNFFPNPGESLLDEACSERVSVKYGYCSFAGYVVPLWTNKMELRSAEGAPSQKVERNPIFQKNRRALCFIVLFSRQLGCLRASPPSFGRPLRSFSPVDVHNKMIPTARRVLATGLMHRKRQMDRHEWIDTTYDSTMWHLRRPFSWLRK